jgi:hypothetical protein
MSADAAMSTVGRLCTRASHCRRGGSTHRHQEKETRPLVELRFR